MLKLKRDVGLFAATCYILGVIIGAGIYVIIGEAAGIAGNSLWASFLLAALIAACTGLSYAELSAMFPFDSAEYLYTQKAFKDRRFSFGIGWLKLVTHIIATSAVALGFGGYLSRITGIDYVLCALVLIVVLTGVNMFGVKKAMELDILMVLIAMLGLLLVLGAGFTSIKAPEFYMPAAGTMPGILTAAALVFFAFLGFENVGNLGEEVRNPKKTLPRALIISVIVSTVLYVLVAIIAVSVISPAELAASPSPLSDVVTALIGTKAGWLMAIMALAATGSTVLGLFIGTSRMLYGMAEERSLPRFFMKVTKKERVPYVAIIMIAVLVAIFIIPGDIRWAAFLTDFGALFIFMVVNFCLIWMRYTHAHLPRSFKVPVNIGKFPLLPAIGLLTCMVLLFSFDKKMFFYGILMFLAGILIYAVFFEKKHKQRQAELLKIETEVAMKKKRKQTAAKGKSGKTANGKSRKTSTGKSRKTSTGKSRKTSKRSKKKPSPAKKKK